MNRMKLRIAVIALATLSILFWGLPGLFGQENTGGSSPGTPEEEGLESASFDTLNGTVVANLPDDCSASDTISGTVVAEPKGESKEEIAQNEDELSGCVVEVQNCQNVKEPPAPEVASSPEPAETALPSKPASTEKPASIATKSATSKPAEHKLPAPPVVCKEAPEVVIGNHHDVGFTCIMPPTPGLITIVLKNKKTGKVLGRKEIKCAAAKKRTPILADKPPECQFPSSATCGAPLSIPGTYDGRSSTSKISVNGKKCLVLVESPRKQIVRVPRDCPSGQCTIVSSECGFVRKATIKLLPAPAVAKAPASKPATAQPAQEPPQAAVNTDLNGLWTATYSQTQSSYSKQECAPTNTCTQQITQTGGNIVISTPGTSGPNFNGTFDGKVASTLQQLGNGSTSNMQLNFDAAAGTLSGECVSNVNGPPTNPGPFRMVFKVVMHRK